jgi:hypothetical protein
MQVPRRTVGELFLSETARSARSRLVSGVDWANWTDAISSSVFSQSSGSTVCASLRAFSKACCASSRRPIFDSTIPRIACISGAFGASVTAVRASVSASFTLPASSNRNAADACPPAAASGRWKSPRKTRMQSPIIASGVRWNSSPYGFSGPGPVNIPLADHCSSSSGKNCPSSFSPAGITGMPRSRDSFVAERTPSRMTFTTVARRARSE